MLCHLELFEEALTQRRSTALSSEHHLASCIGDTDPHRDGSHSDGL